jgi:hypothetical protein
MYIIIPCFRVIGKALRPGIQIFTGVKPRMAESRIVRTKNVNHRSNSHKKPVIKPRIAAKIGLRKEKSAPTGADKLSGGAYHNFAHPTGMIHTLNNNKECMTKWQATITIIS